MIRILDILFFCFMDIVTYDNIKTILESKTEDFVHILVYKYTPNSINLKQVTRRNSYNLAIYKVL